MLTLNLPETDLSETALPRYQAGAEPIVGYRLLEPLGKGGFGVVWKCQAPGGLFKAIKMVRGNAAIATGDPDLARQELHALEFIKNIRHPFVLSVERVELVDNILLIVMELADKSLDDLGHEYRSQGKAGIPRVELLEYLSEAAEALDLINHQHGLQHLDVKPQNLFLVSRHTKVADFGLVSRLARHNQSGDGKGGVCHGVTPRYASPETLRGKLSRQSDQYSLAIVYQELLTGELPFKGRTNAQLFVQHLECLPDLDSLPASDRPVIARALAKDPEQRFRCCADFVRALLLAAPGAADVANPPRSTSGIIRRLKLTATDLGQVEADAAPTQLPTTTEVSLPCETYSLNGHTYQKPLGQTPLGELWLVATPSGEEKIAYHLTGFTVEDRQEQAKALHFLQSLKHPALPRFEIAELGTNRIILMLDTGMPTLLDCRRSKDLPAGDLIGYLTEVAEALDALMTTTNLCHLGLNPGNILLGLDGVQIRDFGLIAKLWRPGSKSLAPCNPRYAAPELAANKSNVASDQYSLAMMYVDLHHSSQASGSKHALPGRSGSTPLVDLSQLPAQERDIVQKAMDKNPKKRFGSNLQFVQALAEAMQQRGIASTMTRSAFLATQVGFLDHLRQWVAQRAAASMLRHAGPTRHRLAPDGSLIREFRAMLMPGTAHLRLEVFRQEWNAVITEAAANEFRLFVPLAGTFWQRLCGKTIGIDIRVHVEPPPRNAGLTGLKVTLLPIRCNPTLLAQLHDNIGPALLSSLQTALCAAPERRQSERIPFTNIITVRHRATGQRPSEIECQGKDISGLGICFLAPIELEAKEIRIHFNLPDQPEAAPVILRAKIARCEIQPNGRYEVGAKFLLDNSSR